MASRWKFSKVSSPRWCDECRQLDLLPVENSYCFCSHHDMLFTSGTCGRVLAHCHILEDDGSKHWKNNNDWTWRAVCLHLKPISLLLVIVDCQTREGVTLLCHKFNNRGLEFGPVVIPSNTCIGARAVVLPGSKILDENVEIMPLTHVLPSEELTVGTWHGSPAEKVDIEYGSKFSS